MMEFHLTIKLGNSAMKTGADVGRTLYNLSQYIDAFGTHGRPSVMSVNIRDYNGTTVGKWEFTEPPDFDTWFEARFSLHPSGIDDDEEFTITDLRAAFRETT